MHWLENWTVSERLSAGCRPAVEAAVAMLEASLAPAGAKERAVALGILFDWVAAYEVARIPDDPEERRVWVAQKMAAYSQDLADLPADLLMQAVDVVRRTRRYSSLPLPGDLRAAVAEPLAVRRAALNKARLALRLNRFEAPPERPVSADDVARLRADAGAALSVREAGHEGAGAPGPPGGVAAAARPEANPIGAETLVRLYRDMVARGGPAAEAARVRLERLERVGGAVDVG